MNPFYTDYPEYLGRFFPGIKVQKISVNAGFSCPNRDGTLGYGGCIYCDNTSFTPSYCFDSGNVSEQIEAGKSFFSRKYPEMKFLAYFQSYTNTLSSDTGYLENIYREAMKASDVVGIIIGTRPDSLPDNVVSLLAGLNKEKKVFVELGAESAHDQTLRLVNRGHVWDDTVSAVRRLSESGLSVGIHLIAGLPGEDDDMVLDTVRRAVELPVESLKMHHLQVLRGTPLERLLENGKISVKNYTVEDYIELCVKIIKLVPQNVAIERFLSSSPPRKVLMPKWGMKNYEFTTRLLHRLEEMRADINVNSL